MDRSCEQWEVDAYMNNVRRYYRALQIYGSEVDQYYRDAAAFIECKSKLD
jgi:hypothetical protein